MKNQANLDHTNQQLLQQQGVAANLAAQLAAANQLNRTNQINQNQVAISVAPINPIIPPMIRGMEVLTMISSMAKANLTHFTGESQEEETKKWLLKAENNL